MDSDEPSSTTGAVEEGKLSDKDMARQEELDQENGEEVNYLETMGGVRLLWACTRCWNLTVTHLWMTTPLPVPGYSQWSFSKALHK